MSRGAILGGGILLALVVGLSIWVGRLRGQVRDGEALLEALTQQRNAAMERARDALGEAELAGEQVAKSRARAALAEEQRGVTEELLAESRQRIAVMRNVRQPTTVHECMNNLATMGQHVSLLDETLKYQSVELRHTKEALALRDRQVALLEGAVLELEEVNRLDQSRIEAMEYVGKKKRIKRIVGFTLGAVGLVGLSFGAGYLVAR